MNTDNDKIERLRAETGMDYGFCQKALYKYRNDYDKALKYINTYNESTSVRTYRRLKNITLGEQSFRFKVYSQNEILIDIPLLLPILIMLLIQVPSFLLALFLLLLMVTDSSITINLVDKKEVPMTVRKQERQKNHIRNKKKKAIRAASNEIIKDSDGYSVIEIQ